MSPGCISGVASSYSSDRSEYLQFCKLKNSFSFCCLKNLPAEFALTCATDHSFFLSIAFVHFSAQLHSICCLCYLPSTCCLHLSSPALDSAFHFHSIMKNLNPLNLKSEHLLLNTAFYLEILDYTCCMHRAKWLSAPISQSFLFTHKTNSTQNFQNYFYAKLCRNFNSNWRTATAPDKNR